MPQENPFQDPLRFERRVPECAMVIFGANGDLTKRKLMPALYRLAYDRRLAAGFAVIGISRSPMSDDQFREKMLEAVKKFSEDTEVEDDLWKTFAAGLYYVAGDIDNPKVYMDLAAKLKQVEEERNTGGNVLFYLSTQPSQYAPAALGIGAAGMGKGNGWRRLIVEKPFGHDLASARELSDKLHQVFAESDVYRIDHYLGKETVQNILAFRFGNGIFEPLWNLRYINHVQITAAESIGVEGRGAYYQEAGALADMIQNHLLQVMATIAMEPSAGFHANAVRDERSKLLRSIRRMNREEILANTALGQYGPGRTGGSAVPGFRQEAGVDPHSKTETYAAATFFIDNWRWAGVPFYLRSGKRLPKRVTEIAIQFNPAPLQLFSSAATDLVEPNVLIVRIQPDEGITLRIGAKVPGQVTRIREVNMDFRFGASFGVSSPEAYERLLLDCILGDSTLYARRDMTERGWEIVMPILEAWQNSKEEIPKYEAGRWGPGEA